VVFTLRAVIISAKLAIALPNFKTNFFKVIPPQFTFLAFGALILA